MANQGYVDLTDDSIEYSEVGKTAANSSTLSQLNNKLLASIANAHGSRGTNSHSIDQSPKMNAQYLNAPILPHKSEEQRREPYILPQQVKYKPPMVMIAGQPETITGGTNHARILPPNLVGAGVDVLLEHQKKMRAFQQMHQKPTYVENSNLDRKYYPPGGYSDLNMDYTF